MIVLDVETTGIVPWKNAIASIGAVDFNHPKNQFYREICISESANVQDGALQVNGFTLEELYDIRKPTLQKVMEEFIEWVSVCEEKTIAGLNPAFDRDFLRAAFHASEIPFPFSHRTIDVHSLCYAHALRRGVPPLMKRGITALSTDPILNYVGLPPEPRPHHALTGAQMEAETLARLIHGTSLLEEFRHYPLPDYLLN
ncbi:3'-5' exoribonuclease [Candidatus Uhrbacteria bacterium]|nr:3'-5' exoribonuclease [Candidatus Uhrbacteria bacterium]